MSGADLVESDSCGSATAAAVNATAERLRYLRGLDAHNKVRMLFDGKNFAVLSTLEPDGKPHSIVVWVKRDGDDILFALPKSRRKTVNLNRDPRAAVVIFDAASPYESAQVRGTASIEDDPDAMLVDELSHKYTGGPYPGFAGPNPQWVIARITADKVTTSWPDS